MTFAEAEAAVRKYLLQDASNPDYYAPAVIQDVLDRAWNKVVALVRALHPSFLSNNTTLTFSAGSPTQSLPADFISVQDAWIKNGDLRTPCNVIPKVRRFEDVGVYLEGDNMGLGPVPVTASTIVEFDYQFRPELPSATPSGMTEIPEEFHESLVLHTAIQLGGPEIVDPASGQTLKELLKAELDSLMVTFERRADEQDRIALSIFWERPHG